MQLFVGFQHCEFAMLRCISMGNSIKFGIDQSPFSIGLIGRFRRGSHCMGSHCQCDPFSMPPHTMNVSISVEKSASTDFKWFYTIIWLFFSLCHGFFFIYSPNIWTWSIVIGSFHPPCHLFLCFYSLKQVIFWNTVEAENAKISENAHKTSEHDSEWWNEQVPAEN